MKHALDQNTKQNLQAPAAKNSVQLLNAKVFRPFSSTNSNSNSDSCPFHGLR